MIHSATAIRLFLARTELVKEWERRVLADDTIASARRLKPFRLRDYVPRFIDIATEALRGDGYQGELQTKAREFARVHVVERIDEEFTMAEVLGELAHLRRVVLAYLSNAPEAHASICDALEDARVVVERAYAESGTREVASLATIANKRGISGSG